MIHVKNNNIIEYHCQIYSTLLHCYIVYYWLLSSYLRLARVTHISGIIRLQDLLLGNNQVNSTREATCMVMFHMDVPSSKAMIINRRLKHGCTLFDGSVRGVNNIVIKYRNIKCLVHNASLYNRASKGSVIWQNQILYNYDV